MKHVFYLAFLFVSCTSHQVSAPVSHSDSSRYQRIVADTTGNPVAMDEAEGYQIKKLLCAELGIYSIEQSDDSIELRLWYEPSMSEPHELYILKAKDTLWKAIRYVFYQRHASYETEEYKYWDSERKPIIDSIRAESMFPRRIGWKQYAANLQIDSLWAFPSQSELKGDYGCLDGYGYTVEIKDKRRYKALRYRCANGRSEQHHIKFANLVDRIETPLRYNGMFVPL
ncbi:MAG: hypothetical protein EOO06_20855 [Chitinophagaceae bacterium]|nr:MAG: hypothetical protein EOO06_20855 [Chitinophagaceae bacterium]